MNLAPLALWLTPYFWDIFKMIGDAIQGALQWFWEHVILNIASLGGYESVLSLKNNYWGIILEIPSTYWVPPTQTLFDYVRNFSLAFFAIVFTIAGVCYLLENFRMLREGTAFNILTNAMFTLVLMYLFLPAFEAARMGFNSLNSSILELDIVHGPAGSTNDPIGYLCDGLVGWGNPVAAILMLITGVTINFLGFVRIILIYALVVMMPLLFVLRLIPFTKGIAEDLINALIGIMIASTLSTLMIMSGACVKSYTALSGFGGMVFSSAVLFAGAFMPTILAPRLGSLFTSTTIAASAAVSMGTQLSVKPMAGMAMGMLTGGATGMATGVLQGGAGAGQLTASGGLGRAGLMLQSGLTGAGKGAIMGAAAGAGGPGGALVAGGRAGLAAGEEGAKGVVQTRMEDSLDMLMDHFAYNANILGNEAEGAQFMQSLGRMPLERVGAQFADTLGVGKIVDTPQERAQFGSSMIKRLSRYTPAQISRIMQGLDKWKELSHKERTALMVNIKAQRKAKPEIMMEAKTPPPKVKVKVTPPEKPEGGGQPPSPAKKKRDFIARGSGGDVNRQIDEWFKKHYGEGFTGEKDKKDKKRKR